MINMGFRFRKSFGTGPFRATISKSGISTSFGVKGARVTKKANGNTMTTLGIPGTGLSYVSEKSNKKQAKTAAATKTSKNTGGSYTMNYEMANRFKYIDDPNVADAPKKAGFLRIAKYNLLGFAIFIALSILAVIVDAPVIMAGGLIGAIAFVIIKCRKWKKPYMPLKVPVAFEDWTDPYSTPPSVLGLLTKGFLTNDQAIAYANILQFCEFGEVEKVFNAAELNATRTEPISNYMLTKLYEAGYLVKPTRGKYALNMVKVHQMNEEFEKLQAEKRVRYDAFIKECEVYNDNARQFNINLAESRKSKK